MSRRVLRALVAAAAVLAVFVVGRWIGGLSWERGDSLLTGYAFTTMWVIAAAGMAWAHPGDNDDKKIGFGWEGK